MEPDEAEWLDDLVEWALGLNDPKTRRLHHRREAVHAAYYLMERARRVKPSGVQPKEVTKLWIANPPTPAYRCEKSGTKVLELSDDAMTRLFRLEDAR